VPPRAHGVAFEYRVLGALADGPVPVPRPVALCPDPAVAGAPFLLTERVPGLVVRTRADLARLSPTERRTVALAMVDVMADLHTIDPDAVGLGDLARGDGHLGRHLRRLGHQLDRHRSRAVPGIDVLRVRLAGSVPSPSASPARHGIVHGDYRLDNLIFHPTEPRSLAVLDWDLSTLGDPLADFTYYTMHWVMPRDGRSGLGGTDFAALGIPTLEEAVALYCKATGRAGLPDVNWYLAYNLFRLAGICQGIAGRVRDGTAASPQAAQMGARVVPLAEAAWTYAVKAGA
jgi:aminoglycoside phosphotransferase (APT) family kinase protein